LAKFLQNTLAGRIVNLNNRSESAAESRVRKGFDKNLLVISDLHLGEDLRPAGANVSYLRHLVRLERELESFLTHYTQHRIDGRPWSLVVNGDMVDFMSVMILPDAAAADGDAHEDAEDRLYGLGFGERQSQRKLERVMARHQGVFGRLAEFVAAGNDLVIVMGNHDVEFHYPSVQRTLVEWLCGLAVGVGAPEESRAAFAQRIQFCPWFYYRENVIYIEHGHQYDEYCSFDYLLHPVARPRGGKKSRIALSVAHAGMRYFANQLPEYDPHTAEQWGFLDYMKWGRTQGLRGAIRLSYFYGLLVWRLVELWYLLVDRQSDSERRAVHYERLRELSTHWKIAEEKLLALDALRRPPVTKRLVKLMAALFIDRLFLGAGALGLALALSVRLHGLWRVAGPLGTLVAAAVVNEVLNRLRLESPAARLRLAPQLIRRVLGAPFIVFGHSHAPETLSLDGGGVYFNTGTWASDDARYAFTHLLVTRRSDGEALQAELRQWRDGSSAPYRV
jgi:UDP-2,3-diacylglucosamine pyrophosphatase LpxH